VLGQLVNRGHVARVAGEADDVAPAALGAVSRLELRHHAEGVQRLARLRRKLAPSANLAERVLVHAAVLPHLELGQVEPERLGLPHELLHLA